MTIKIIKKVYGGIQSLSYSSQKRYKLASQPWHWKPNADGSVGPVYIPVTDESEADFISGQPFLGYLVPRYDSADSGYTYDPSWPGGGYYGGSTPLAYHSLVSTPSAGFNQTVNTRILEYLESHDSSNTPGWFGTQGAKSDVLSLTKGKPPLRRPIRPVLFSPSVKLGPKPHLKPRVVLRLIPPTRSRGEGLSTFQARLDRWTSSKKRKEVRLTALNNVDYQRRLERYKEKERKFLVSDRRRLENHKKALEKFDLRYKKYLLLVEQAKAMHYHRSPRSSIVHKDNPYWSLKMAFTGSPLRSRFSWNFPWRTNAPWEPGFPFGVETVSYYQSLRYYGIYAVYSTYVMDISLPEEELSLYVDNTRKHITNLANAAVVDFDEKLKRKINQKLKSQTVHIGNIIAERKQTFDLVQSSVKRILELIKLKKNIFRAAASYASSPKKLANDILAFKFGVEPLMNDIMSFAKYIDESSDSPVLMVRANTGPKKIPFNLDLPGLKFVGSIRISYVVKCQIENPASRSLSQFGLINPLEILWEVTPWSFVVDWFFPVGDWISNKTADCGISFLTGTRTLHMEGFFSSGDLQSPSSLPGSYELGSEGVFRAFSGEITDRTVLTDIPNLPPIKLKNPWSWSHGVESVSLLVQKLKIR